MSLEAQENKNWDSGGKIGLVLYGGSKINRLGFTAGAYLMKDHIQFNTLGSILYSFNNLGPKKRGVEGHLGIGILGAVGKPVSTENIHISLVSNQLYRPYALGIAYKWYFDQIGTSQQTGLLGLHFKNISILSENDAFVGQGKDRYRTGAILLQYRYEDYQFALSNIMWTGDPKSPKAIRVRKTDYPARFGYFDISNSKYGAYSHGILGLQVERAFRYKQTIRAFAGIDAEQIRHFVQNKFIHDMPFIPNKWNTAENPHYPMIDENGNQYLYGEDQRLRKAKFFWYLSMNPYLFY